MAATIKNTAKMVFVTSSISSTKQFLLLADDIKETPNATKNVNKRQKHSGGRKCRLAECNKKEKEKKIGFQVSLQLI